MKIAFTTNTGDIIGQHFGRVKYYRVFTLEDGKVAGDEMREKFLVHGQHHQNRHHEIAGEPHGFGHEARQHHLSMIEPIRDCDVLIAGMMSRGAFHQIQSAGIEVILTDMKFVDDALRAYLDGELVNKAAERIH